MEGNDYVIEILVRERLAAARADMARERLATSALAPRRRLRAIVARALVSLARRIDAAVTGPA